MKEQTTAQLVKEYFKSAGSSSANVAARDLKRPRTAVYAAIRDLLKVGYLTKDEFMLGLYHYAGQARKAPELQQKLWRAARINKTFTNFDLARYSGATLDYTKRYVSFLQKQGHVSHVGRKGQKFIFKVSPDAPFETPYMADSKPQDGKHDLAILALDLLHAIRGADMETAREKHAGIGALLGGNHGA